MKKILFLLYICTCSVHMCSQCMNLNNCETFVYTEIDEMPVFSNDSGMSALQYIQSKIRYPNEADVTGTIIVSFVVNCTGDISNIKLERALYDECDNDVIRLISSMPKWKAGKSKGKPVNTILYLPIKIKMR